MTAGEAYLEAVEELGLDAPSEDIFDYAVDIYDGAHRELRYHQSRDLMRMWYESDLQV